MQTSLIRRRRKEAFPLLPEDLALEPDPLPLPDRQFVESVETVLETYGTTLTPNPKPRNSNPNLHLQTLDPKRLTPNLKPSTPNPKS